MFNTDKKIKFYIREDRAGAFPEPVPTKAVLPDWYKNTPPFIVDKPVIRVQSGGAAPTGTVKKCIPFLDAMSAGYVIRLHADVYVEPTTDGGPDFTWTLDDVPIIAVHSYEQVSTIPGAHALAGGIPFKWMTPWHIETPPGYSCLITHPMNHRETRWEIMAGIVDTDSYNLQINFPFFWMDKNFKGVIKRGTPIAQVIPFKRESWGMEIINKDPKNHQNGLKKLSSKISDAYKTFWWTKKEWR
jgi:hypothetical protein